MDLLPGLLDRYELCYVIIFRCHEEGETMSCLMASCIGSDGGRERLPSQLFLGR